MVLISKEMNNIISGHIRRKLTHTGFYRKLKFESYMMCGWVGLLLKCKKAKLVHFWDAHITAG